MRFKAARHFLTAVLGTLLLAGCSAAPDADRSVVTNAIPPSDQRPSDEGVALGKRHYAAGDYGLAERHFRAAAEANPKSAEAWLGLAAAYDRLGRFELAERAYRRTIELQGKTSAVLNNLGYHYLLRGQIKRAREHLQAAAAMDPKDPKVQGNLRLLETWKKGS